MELFLTRNTNIFSANLAFFTASWFLNTNVFTSSFDQRFAWHFFSIANSVWHLFSHVDSFTAFHHFGHHDGFGVAFFDWLFDGFGVWNFHSFPDFFCGGHAFSDDFSSVASDLFRHFDGFFAGNFHLLSHGSVASFEFRLRRARFRA